MWTLVVAFIYGTIGGVCAVSCIFTGLFILVISGYFDFKRLSVRTEEKYSWICPFESSQITQPSPKSLKVEGPEETLVESCEWLNRLLALVLFNREASTIASHVQERLLGKLSSRLSLLGREKFYLNNLWLKELNLGQVAPQLKAFRSSISTHGALSLSLNHSYESGDATVCFEGELGIGLGKFSTLLRLQSFTGTALFLFDERLKFKFMLTALPRFSFALDYANQRLGRLSNVLVLVVESLLKNHLVFPNYQSILLLPGATARRDLFFAPVWKSSRLFLRIKLDSINLAPTALERLGNGTLVSCILLFNGVKVKGEEQYPVKNLRFTVRHQLALPEINHEELQITLTLWLRRRKYSKKSPFAVATIPLKSIQKNTVSLQRVSFKKNRDLLQTSVDGEGGELGWSDLSLFYCTDPQMVIDADEWPHLRSVQSTGKDASTGEKQEYLDGMDWNNVKLAWRKFRKVSSNDDHLPMDSQVPRQIEVIIRELDQNPASLTPTPPETYSDCSLTSSDEVPTQKISETVTAGFEIIPEIWGEEGIQDIHIQNPCLRLFCDANKVSADILGPSSGVASTRFTVWLERWGSVELYLTQSVIVFCRRESPLHAVKLIPFDSLIAVCVDGNADASGRRKVILQLYQLQDYSFRASEDVLGPLMVELCRMQKVLSHRFRLESCRHGHLAQLGSHGFLPIIYAVGLEEQSTILPIGPIGDAHGSHAHAEVVLRRMCRRATMLNKAPSPYEVRIEIGAAGKTPQTPRESLDIDCFQAKSIPTPVILSLDWMGIRVTRRFGSGFTFLPLELIHSVSLVKTWRGLCVTFRCHLMDEVVKVLQLSDREIDFLRAWCARNTIEIVEKASRQP